jgi:hypothetical protein
MKKKTTGKKVSEKIGKVIDKSEIDRIIRKHAEDSSACEEVYKTPEGHKKAGEILSKLGIHQTPA